MPMDALGCVGGTGVTALTRRIRRAVDECMKLSTTEMALKTHGFLNDRYPPTVRVSLLACSYGGKDGRARCAAVRLLST